VNKEERFTPLCIFIFLVCSIAEVLYGRTVYYNRTQMHYTNHFAVSKNGFELQGTNWSIRSEVLLELLSLGILSKTGLQEQKRDTLLSWYS
jgi:hypothetical protein